MIVYPEMADGVAPRDLNYRFQWNAPILVSRHDPDVVFHTSNYVHRTTDGGLSWVTISPDLTVGDPEKGALPGGPVQHDHTGVEVYGTIFALEESPRVDGLLWAGTDDGRVHFSRDGGDSWNEVTPPDMPAGGTVNSMDISAHHDGGVLLAVQRYRENDFEPYVFRTTDFGASWTSLGSDGGIPAGHPVRVVREDPVNDEILYLGTEFGLFASFDGGTRFVPLGDLPATPITDLQVAGDELLVATQGRSFWVLDDLTPVRALAGRSWDAPALLPAGTAVRLATGGSRPFRGPGAPENRPAGALLHYFLPKDLEEGDELRIRVRDASGEMIREFVRKPEPGEEPEESADERPNPDAVLEGEAGLQRIAWDLKYRRPELLKGAVMSISYTGGAFVQPGTYSASLVFQKDGGGEIVGDPVRFGVLKDPRVAASDDDLRQQHDLVRQAQTLLERVHERIGAIRDARDQFEAVEKRARQADRWTDALEEQAETLRKGLTEVEEELIQTKNESGQDPLNFPPKLDNQIAYLYGHVARNYGRPTGGSFERFRDLEAEAAPLLERLASLLGAGVADLNRALAEAGVTGGVLVKPSP